MRKIVQFLFPPLSFAILCIFVYFIFVLQSPSSIAVSTELDISQNNAYTEDYTNRFYEITCYDIIENIVFHDWSETELVPYSDRLEYLSATSNRVESIYNGIVCKCTPPPPKTVNEIDI